MERVIPNIHQPEKDSEEKLAFKAPSETEKKNLLKPAKNKNTNYRKFYFGQS